VSRAPLALGERVRIYRHLRKQCYSVLHAWGLLAGHYDELTLVDVEFRVRAAGRARVLASRQKNVHAFVVGTVASHAPPAAAAIRVRYDPYTGATFVTLEGAPVRRAARVVLTPAGVFAEGAE